MDGKGTKDTENGDGNTKLRSEAIWLSITTMVGFDIVLGR